MHGGGGGQLGILVAAWLQLGASAVPSVAALRRKAQWQRSGGSGSGVSVAVAAAAWQRWWQHGVGVGGWHLQKRSGSIVASVVETRTTIKNEANDNGGNGGGSAAAVELWRQRCC